MNFYKVFVDIALDCDWDNIDVANYIVKAQDTADASEIAYNKARQDFPDSDYYVWSVDPDDLITDETFDEDDYIE